MTQDLKHRGSETAWLNAAYDMLTESGVDSVKVMPLAKRVGLSRTGFYWHFKDREALLDAMVRRWEEKNTGNLVSQCQAYAESIIEAIFNVFDCWLDETLFDSRLDLAIRNWARNDPALQVRLDTADAKRAAALRDMYLKFGYDETEANVRAMTVIYTQIGYFSMRVRESHTNRIAAMPDYAKVFTGHVPTTSETERFFGRHGGGVAKRAYPIV